MKNGLILLLIIVINLSSGLALQTEMIQPPGDMIRQPKTDIVSSQPLETLPLGSVQEMIDLVNQERVLTNLKRLSGIEPICFNGDCFTIKSRDLGSEGLQWAKDYVYAALTNLHYSVEIQDWSRDDKSEQNIIARKEGLIFPNEEIYFVAHLDSKNLDGTDSAPGADDNASGVSDLLELARIFSNKSISRTVVFFFDTGEEYGCLGVRSYLDQLSPGKLEQIKYVINQDMLSYDANDDGVMELWSGDHAPSLALAHTMSEIIQVYGIGLEASIVTGCD